MLERSGWRFFDEDGRLGNIHLESKVSGQEELDAMGDDFENVGRGFVDYLLVDERGRPLVVLEAKSASKQPLVGKEQARSYARRKNCRYVILSNGHLHYFWDVEQGNPSTITEFPRPESVGEIVKRQPPDRGRLVDEAVNADYIMKTKMPDYKLRAGWINEDERDEFMRVNGLRLMREYQVNAVKSIQRAVKRGNDRFLFEMATGTGKTLVAAAIIKLFLRTGNASRVLFLVDRLELENQAKRAFEDYLKPDYSTVIYKDDRSGWRRHEIVVTTVQSLLVNNKYVELFSPTDFDLVISDEAHRSINGNARDVFNYFMGYKLGLTATPRNYLRNVKAGDASVLDPREMERRLLLDTYRTFGCESGRPTFSYSLLDGVKDGHLINPKVVDARTEVSTEMLSEQGFLVTFTDEEGEETTATMQRRHFERTFFSDSTNQEFCAVFLEHALRDPISKEIGKSIIFCVSQSHAAKLTNILNEFAMQMFPGRYQSDFAVQVTSVIPTAQRFAMNFANNNLNDRSQFIEGYLTSKTRVCVTVGMMTTGYDCPDILNLGLMRPIFSPTDFIQIKGRGTRKHDFRDQAIEKYLKEGSPNAEKTSFNLIDFFGNYEYFETEYDYDEVLKLPPISKGQNGDDGPENGAVTKRLNMFTYLGEDELHSLREEQIGTVGMKVDRMMFNRFADDAKKDETLREAVENEAWEKAQDYVRQQIFDKPEEYYTLDKLREALNLDRRVSLREILEHVFGLIPKIKSRAELLDEEFGKFIAQHAPEDVGSIPAIKAFFVAYAGDESVRIIVDGGSFADLATNAGFSLADYGRVPEEYRELVREYVKDWVVLNQFV